jgi:hypothetical protein
LVTAVSEQPATGPPLSSPGGITIVLEIQDGPAIRTELSAYDEAFRSWAAARAGDGRPIGGPPAQPAEFLNTLSIALKDDVGTTYVPRGRHAGGSGTEREGVWHFSPLPAPDAMQLTVTVDESPCSVRRSSCGGWK